MIDTSDFKTGLTIELDGDPCKIVDFQHVKPGKGAAFVRTKIKNLKTGASIERTFRPGEKLQDAIMERQQMQYLYLQVRLFQVRFLNLSAVSLCLNISFYTV